MSENVESEDRAPASEEMDKLVAEFFKKAGEFSDSILVLATVHDHESGSTWNMQRQYGNVMANQGAAREYVIQNEEEDREQVRQRRAEES